MGSAEACEGTSPEGSKVPVDIAEGSIEQFAPRDDDQVHRGVRWFVHQSEHLSNQPFSPVSVDRVAELARGDDAEPDTRGRARREQQSEKPGRDARVGLEHPGELASTSHSLGLAERVRRQGSRRYDDETVSRLRPLARRRLSTSRPFLVAIRVRKPCVLARWRRFGWKVRFMIRDP